jgi:hypothetical protein
MMMTAVDYRKHLRDRLMQVGIPFHLWEGLVEYLSDRRPVGGFLTAVLSNDLTTASVRADPMVREHLVDVVLFLVNYAPADAWGSERKVAAWLAAPEPVIPVID